MDNDPMRREPWAPLTDAQKADVKEVKDTGHELWECLHRVAGGADPRCIALAKTKLEEAVMWAVKGITAPREDG